MWSNYLDTCVFAYNMSQQDSTKFTQFELMIGQKATLPSDIDTQKNPETITDVSMKDIQGLNEERKKQLQKAKSNTVATQKKQKEYYDKRRAKPLCYNTGAISW